MNKKVKNAVECEYRGIQFKSKLEKASYKLLSEAGLKPKYEPRTFHLWEGKSFTVPCYDLHNDRKLHRDVWGINSYKSLSIKYTPDFVFTIKDTSGTERMVIMEAKGKQNDVYPYKKKLFREWLETNQPDSIFFEVHNQKQVKAAIEIIKQIQQSNLQDNV